MSDPIVLFVRRGAERRFEALKKKTEGLGVAVQWDRRERPRRTATAVSGPERRRAERRQSISEVWEAAKFSVGIPRRSR